MKPKDAVTSVLLHVAATLASDVVLDVLSDANTDDVAIDGVEECCSVSDDTDVCTFFRTGSTKSKSIITFTYVVHIIQYCVVNDVSNA